VARSDRRIQALFAKSVEELRSAGVEFAVVGGIAISARGRPRTTDDFDFAISVKSDVDAERVVFALQARGFLVTEVFENDAGRVSTVRTLRAEWSDIYVDFLLYNTRIEPEIVSRATIETVWGVLDVPVALRDDLLAMKVLANRTKDGPDIEHLLVEATPAQLKRVRSTLRRIERRGAAPDRDLIAEFDEHVRDVLERPAHERPVSPERLRRILRRKP
jgi:hypothetical protein